MWCLILAAPLLRITRKSEPMSVSKHRHQHHRFEGRDMEQHQQSCNLRGSEDRINSCTRNAYMGETGSAVSVKKLYEGGHSWSCCFRLMPLRQVFLWNHDEFIMSTWRWMLPGLLFGCFDMEMLVSKSVVSVSCTCTCDCDCNCKYNLNVSKNACIHEGMMKSYLNIVGGSCRICLHAFILLGHYRKEDITIGLD